MFKLLLLLILNLSAEEALQKVNSMRNPKKSYKVEVKIITDKEVFELEVFVKGKDKTIVKFNSPAKWKGRLLLLNENNMWFCTFHSRPIRIAPIHRLVGGFSNADIASRYYSNDYDPEIKEETEEHYILKLSPKTNIAAYGNIEMEFSKLEYQLKKADFYSLSGKWMKEVLYSNYEKTGTDGVYYTKIVVFDKIRDNEETTMEFGSFSEINIPDYMFNKDYLPRFRY